MGDSKMATTRDSPYKFLGLIAELIQKIPSIYEYQNTMMKQCMPTWYGEQVNRWKQLMLSKQKKVKTDIIVANIRELSLCCTTDDSMTVKVTHQCTCAWVDFAIRQSSKFYNTAWKLSWWGHNIWCLTIVEAVHCANRKLAINLRCQTSMLFSGPGMKSGSCFISGKF